MQKRRDRIEKWRQERKKQQDLVPINISQPARQWTLEDDEDEDEDDVNNGADADEVMDPLDAYMQVQCLSVLVTYSDRCWCCEVKVLQPHFV